MGQSVDTNGIYNQKTKEYMDDVLSSYYAGNNRAATVILYSVTIFDLISKLKELSELYENKKAKTILDRIEKIKKDDKYIPSKWEKELIEEVRKSTDLIDTKTYTAIKNLIDLRNYSAHPLLNSDYELVKPSSEATIAAINDITEGLFVKPPFFMNEIIDMLTEELERKKQLLEYDRDKLNDYLSSKYFSKMTLKMKEKTLKPMWKLCFVNKDERCVMNRAINQYALEALISTFPGEANAYIEENKDAFMTNDEDDTMIGLIHLLSRNEDIYKALSDTLKKQTEQATQKDNSLYMVSWFQYDDIDDYFKNICTMYKDTCDQSYIVGAINYCKTIGKLNEIIDTFLKIFENSHSFRSADDRFNRIIKPNIDNFNHHQYEELLKIMYTNGQIYASFYLSEMEKCIANSYKKTQGSNLDINNYKSQYLKLGSD